MYNKYLKTFIEVAEYGSFTKAAEHLYISSVGVQKQVSSLEKELDLKLFERTNQGVELTYAGQRIYNDSKKLIEYCENEIQVIKEKENYCLKIANFLIKKEDYINECLLKKCKQKYFMLPFILGEKRGFQDFEKEMKNEFDAFVFVKFDRRFMRGWDYKCLFNTSLKLVVPKEHKLAKKRKISYSDLQNETICFLGNGILEEYDDLNKKILQKIPSLKVINYDVEKLSLTDSLYIMKKYPIVTIDGIDFLVSDSKSIPFSFNTDISIGLYTKNDFLD